MISKERTGSPDGKGRPLQTQDQQAPVHMALPKSSGWSKIMLGHIRACEDGGEEDSPFSCIKKEPRSHSKMYTLLKMSRTQFFPKIFYFRNILAKLVFPL